jgi:hypothetical protein
MKAKEAKWARLRQEDEYKDRMKKQYDEENKDLYTDTRFCRTRSCLLVAGTVIRFIGFLTALYCLGPRHGFMGLVTYYFGFLYNPCYKLDRKIFDQSPAEAYRMNAYAHMSFAAMFCFLWFMSYSAEFSSDFYELEHRIVDLSCCINMVLLVCNGALNFKESTILFKEEEEKKE